MRSEVMKREGIAKYIAFSVFGFAVLVAGLVGAILLPGAKGVMLTLPYVCVGIGAGIFGGNLGTAIRLHLIRKDPKLAKRAEIEAKDERNIAISNKAKAKAYDLVQIVFGVLLLAFALIQVDMYVILTLVAADLFIVFSMIYYLNKYQKEM
ncbi:hypothetical protein [Clostridium thermosuccinogenes]|nr:hypothetical protein [Pseudoclostridium thermosuccinogenes]